MTVKQSLMINSAVLTLSVVGILATLFLTAHLVMQALDANRMADSLITTQFERLMLRTDYIHTGSERAREQIVAKNAQIQSLLKIAPAMFTDYDDHETLYALTESNNSIGKIFRAIVENRKKSGSKAPTEGFAVEVESRLLSQLDMRIYEVILLGGKLQESANNALLLAFRIAGFTILFVLLLSGAITVINSLIMGRTISGKIALLRDGAAAIGKGNLHYRIDVKGADEFTNLSREFNAMTEKLNKSYLDLENEIAERTRIEEALLESRERLSMALTSSGMASFDWDMIEDKRIWDENVHILMGTRPESFSGSHDEFFRIIHQDDREAVQEALAGAIATEEYKTEYRVVWPDGSVHYIAARGKILHDPSGKAVRLTGLCWDITERKQVEEELKRVHTELEKRVLERTEALCRVNEELEIEIARRKLAAENLKFANAYNRSLIEASLDPLVTINVQGKITDINLATEKVTGFSREEIIGADFSGFFTEPEKASSGYQKVFSTGSVTDYALEIRHRDGHITPVLYNAAVYRNENGTVIGVFAAARDISERINAETALFRLNRLYSVLSKVNEMIVRVNNPQDLYENVCRIAVEYGLFKMAWIGIKDPDTLIVNPVASFGDQAGYLNNIGVTAADTPAGKGPTGRAIYEENHIICSDFEEDHNMLPWRDKARQHGYRSSAAFPLRIAGKVFGALTIYSHLPQFFTEEEINLLSSMTEDISYALDAMENEKKRIEAEEALRKINEELEQRVSERTADLELANKELESFSYSVSHDLRAPLRHMSGFIELLQRRFKGHMDETTRHYTTVISEASKKMGALIDDLLVFSRIGRSEMQRKPVDLSELTKAAINEIMSYEKNRCIKWKIDKLPRVYGDPSLLSLALVNLISNAVKFTRTRPVAEIEIKCTDNKTEYVCRVKDNGVGFNMKYADKIFDVFQRLHTQEEFEGTGIGLANVQRIISRHGGRTWAEGSEEHGASFYFTLPKNPEV